jgi:hypothetical protein
VTTDARKFKASWGATYKPFDLKNDDDGAEDQVEWRGLMGDVIAGSDSLLLRKDCVAALAGRLTIRAKDRYLINTQLMGAVELCGLQDVPVPTLAQVKSEQLPTLELPKEAATVDMFVGISFEGATSEQAWAAEEYRQKTFFRYQRLLRGSFVASGKGYFKNGLLDHVELDVLALTGEKT